MRLSSKAKAESIAERSCVSSKGFFEPARAGQAQIDERAAAKSRAIGGEKRLRGWLRRTLTITLDFNWLYRVLFSHIARAAGNALGALITLTERLAARGWLGLERRAEYFHGPQGALA